MAHYLDGVTSATMRDRIEQLFRTSPHYRVQHFLLGPERVLEWVHSIGVATEPSLSECVPLLPPLALRSITAETDPSLYLFTGFYDLDRLVSLYRAHARHVPPRPRILDFGCGCGRMTRFLSPQSWDIYASEVNPDHVTWCRENLPTVDTRTNGSEPPLPFDDAWFDFVYSLSIFSHLAVPLIGAWLRDLARVSAPGGIVAVTFHGPHALEVIAKSAEHQAALAMSRTQALTMRERLPIEGAMLVPYPDDVLRPINVGTTEYGNTFVWPGWIAALSREHGLEPVTHVEGGLRDFQDILVLRRV